MSDETSSFLVVVAIMSAIVACMFCVAQCQYKSEQARESTTQKFISEGYIQTYEKGNSNPVWIKPTSN